LLWPTININKPRARLGIGRVRARAVCWLLKQARAAVDENEEAASSNRPRYEARHMPSAAMASRAARAGRRQLNSSNAARRSACAIRLAPRCPTYSRNSTERREGVRSKRHAIEVQGAFKPARAIAHDVASSAGLSQWEDLGNCLQDHQRCRVQFQVPIAR